MDSIEATVLFEISFSSSSVENRTRRDSREDCDGMIICVALTGIVTAFDRVECCESLLRAPMVEIENKPLSLFEEC